MRLALSLRGLRLGEGPMRRFWVGLVLPGAVMAVAACAAPLGPAGAGAAPAVSQVGAWGKAIAVPGLAALNKGGFAKVLSVSCATAGNCSAGGFYADRSGRDQAFVVGERNGRWGNAIEVHGSAALNTGEGVGGDGFSVSCASAGNCSAGGHYLNSSTFRTQVFVVGERNGRWGKGIEVPGLGALDKGGVAELLSVSCGSAGNCSGGGSYQDGSQHSQAFTVSERNGRWGKAIEVPGLGTLNTGGNAAVRSVSCPSAGNCAAAGVFTRARYAVAEEVFMVSERNGRWGKAIEVPGPGALNTGQSALVRSVSCPSAGNCTAGGWYSDRSSPSRIQAFVVSERNGRWTNAIGVPGLAALNKGNDVDLGSLSCASAGNCAAGGHYTDSSSHDQAFVVGERNGRWGKAIEVPGLAALNTGGDAAVLSVSCTAAGNCAAGGSYWDRSLHSQAFVVGERNGSWGKAIKVPGSAARNRGGAAEVLSVSCPSAGNCVAGGYYSPSRNTTQAFVISQQ
jgi:hypothetical protein